MERYDGKTRRDDYIKYGLITAAVIILVVGLIALTHFLKQRSQTEPDYKLVIGCSESLSKDVLDDLENAIGNVVGDVNGDEKVYIEIQSLQLVDASENIDEADITGNLDDDFNRMALYLANGEYTLFLLSDEPSGAFRGAATTYCEAGYFAPLPDDIADSSDDSRMDLSGAPFLNEIGLEDIPFYGCVLESADQAEYEEATNILRALETAHVTLW
jgi:hypothetical protein